MCLLCDISRGAYQKDRDRRHGARGQLGSAAIGRSAFLTGFGTAFCSPSRSLRINGLFTNSVDQAAIGPDNNRPRSAAPWRACQPFRSRPAQAVTRTTRETSRHQVCRCATVPNPKRPRRLASQAFGGLCARSVVRIAGTLRCLLARRTRQHSLAMLELRPVSSGDGRVPAVGPDVPRSCIVHLVVTKTGQTGGTAPACGGARRISTRKAGRGHSACYGCTMACSAARINRGARPAGDAHQTSRTRPRHR